MAEPKSRKTFLESLKESFPNVKYHGVDYEAANRKVDRAIEENIPEGTQEFAKDASRYVVPQNDEELALAAVGGIGNLARGAVAKTAAKIFGGAKNAVKTVDWGNKKSDKDVTVREVNWGGPKAKEGPAKVQDVVFSSRKDEPVVVKDVRFGGVEPSKSPSSSRPSDSVSFPKVDTDTTRTASLKRKKESQPPANEPTIDYSAGGMTRTEKERKLMELEAQRKAANAIKSGEVDDGKTPKRLALPKK